LYFITKGRKTSSSLLPGDFIDGVVILWRPNLPIPNLPNLSILHIWHALYPQNHGLSNLYSLKKCHKNVAKSFKTPGKNLERFDNYGKSFK
jgi:hypothetical protein